MTHDGSSTSDNSAAEGESGASPMTAPLPTVPTGLSRDEIRARLDAAARRGRLPGFSTATGDAAFLIRDIGRPCESELLADLQPSAGGPGAEVRFRLRLRPLMPAVYVVVLVLTVWPGVWFMESFLGLFPGSAGWMWSGWWYIPLTVLSAPFAMRSVLRTSRATAREDAEKLIAVVAGELGSAAAAQPTPR